MEKLGPAMRFERLCKKIIRHLCTLMAENLQCSAEEFDLT